MYNYNKSVLSLWSYKACNLFYFASGRRSYIKLWSECQKGGFFWWRCALHWRAEHRNLCRFWLWYYFLPWNSYKIRQINREWNYISRSCEKPQCIPSNDQHICSVDEQHRSDIFVNPYNLWNMAPAAFISLNHTNDKYSMSNQYPQPTTHHSRTDSYPAFSSLRTMDSKRKGLRVSFAFFQRNYLPDGRVNETVATVEELSDLLKPGAMDGSPPFVMNCNCI